MQVEVNLPNVDGVLLPGAFIQVALPLKASQATTVSTNTLMFRGDGIRVAVVDGEGNVKLRQVKIGRNYGETVQILEGIGPSDRVVLNPSDSISDGDKVTVVVAQPGKGAPGKSGGPTKGGDGAVPAKEKERS